MVGAYIGIHCWNLFTSKVNKDISIVSLVILFVIWCFRFIQIKNEIQIDYYLGVVILFISGFAFWYASDLVIDRIKPRKIYSHSFWIYATHSDIGAVVSKILWIIMPKNYGVAIINFILTTVLTILIIEIMIFVINRFSPKLCSLLSGERVEIIKE